MFISRNSGLGCASCAGTCGKGMGDLDPEAAALAAIFDGTGPVSSFLPAMPTMPDSSSWHPANWSWQTWAWIGGGLLAFWFLSGSAGKRSASSETAEMKRLRESTALIRPRRKRRARRRFPKVSIG